MHPSSCLGCLILPLPRHVLIHVLVVYSLVVCTQEYERRFSVWLDNLEFVHSHNEKESTFKVRHVTFENV